MCSTSGEVEQAKLKIEELTPILKIEELTPIF